MGEKDLVPGAYESVVTAALSRELARLPADAVALTVLDPADVPDRLAMLATDLVRRVLEYLDLESRATEGPAIVRQVAELLMQRSPAVDAGDLAIVPASMLDSIGLRTPDGGWAHPSRPLTPLLDTALLTGSPGEPSLLAQLASEIPSASDIDVLVAFIRQTGIRPLLGALREHVAAGKPLRILTTTYTGSTERKALDLLADLGADIRVSYDETGTRLHAKSWLFRRPSGLSTAYVGSSNLTYQAQVTGLEWNVRLSGQRNRVAVDKLSAVFDSYWLNGDFVPYDPDAFDRRIRGGKESKHSDLLPFDITPHPFQRRMLDQLALCRASGRHRNLVVAATGTGKTVLSAFDYRSLREDLPSSRLLFVAHRYEILEQSILTFRQVLRDPSFGELWVGGEKPKHFNHVFASIQSLTSSGLDSLEPGRFDVIVVDEFHHAASQSYRDLLERARPSELLGLTATPERMDGKSVLGWFGDRIAVELRLWDAIDQQRLVPFIYYGVDDGSDLRSVPRRGREYESDALGNAYTSNEHWIRNVIRETKRLVPNEQRLKALGFCASVSHAEFTASAFSEAGIPSAALSGHTPAAERRQVLNDLRSGRLKAIFSVDVLSEGVDLPEANAVMLMRPTQSATVFLQQLGRGLRKSEGKDACLVLDFIGAQSEDFRFDLRYRALLGGSRSDLERAVKEGFPYLPAGCQILLEPTPASRVLQSLRRAIPSSAAQQVQELVRLAQSSDPGLGDFLRETGLDLADVYRHDRSWMTLRQQAGLEVAQSSSYGSILRRAIGRLLHIDDDLRIDRYLDWLGSDIAPAPESEFDRRLLRMLVAAATRSLRDIASGSLDRATVAVWADSQVRGDLVALMQVLRDKVMTRGYSVTALDSLQDIPLRVHARYTRDEILAAVGAKQQSTRPPSWQSGVWFEQKARVDLMAFTLDKSGRSFSPSTRYRDYAISDSLIHWESQSATREASETGQRYVHHRSRGSSVLLFARESTVDRAFWFLGEADYVQHEGERPMAITWRLRVPLPDDLYGVMAAAVA